MKHYAISPNKDTTAWYIKPEDVAVSEEYDNLDKAIEAGERMAKENRPSKLIILNKYHEEEETRTYGDE